MLFSKKLPVSWLIVGLGNPGEKYEDTRHNVGFLVADELGERGGFPIQRLKFKALTNTAVLGGEKVLLMKPVTYMNLSGEAVEQATRRFDEAQKTTILMRKKKATSTTNTSRNRTFSRFSWTRRGSKTSRTIWRSCRTRESSGSCATMD